VAWRRKDWSDAHSRTAAGALVQTCQCRQRSGGDAALDDRQNFLDHQIVGSQQAFRVSPLKQQRALCLADEHAAIALPRRLKVWERDVLLECDGQPMVYAHTVVPADDTTNDWPFFRSLGTRSLGSALFSDPLIRRGQLQYARLPVNHPLMRRAVAVLGADALRYPVYARRCLYRRKRGHLLVTEVFLPSITGLSPIGGNSKNNQQQ
jgi:chorismate lyase